MDSPGRHSISPPEPPAFLLEDVISTAAIAVSLPGPGREEYLQQEVAFNERSSAVPEFEDCVLDGHTLSLDLLHRIAVGQGRIVLDERMLHRVADCRAALLAAIKAGQPVYGTTTLVGAFKDRTVDPQEIDSYNRRLMNSHHLGIGEPQDETIVRAAIAVRINTAMTGSAGASPALLTALCELLNAGITPLVREYGSIGCADVGLMAQIGSVLMGGGEVIRPGCLAPGHIVPGADALAQAGLPPFLPGPKDAMVLISSNALTMASVALSVGNLRRAFFAAFAAYGVSCAGFGAFRTPWLAACRIGSDAESRVAAFFIESFREDQWVSRGNIQDPLSFRCMPQIAGAAVAALEHVEAVLAHSLNASDDNPIVAGEDILPSGGSLPLELTLAVESLMLAVAHLGRAAFNRILVMCRDDISGLPRNLTPLDGSVIAFGAATKQAADLCVTLLHESMPVSIYQTTVANGIEDEATNLPLVARKLRRQADLFGKLIAHEAVVAAQSLWLSPVPAQLEGLAGTAARLVGSVVAPVDDQRMLSMDFMAAERSLFDRDWLDRIMVRFPLRTAGAAARGQCWSDSQAWFDPPVRTDLAEHVAGDAG